MASFPSDQFDELPSDLSRVGAHRSPPRRGRGWIRFAWAALATGVLVAVALVGLSRLDPSLDLGLPGATAPASATPSVSSTPAAAAITDPTKVPAGLALTISVLNGTTTTGLQDTAADIIQKAGWPNPGRAIATDTALKTTTVYYSSADYEGVARGLAQLLGVETVQLSDAFVSDPITIVLGADYQP